MKQYFLKIGFPAMLAVVAVSAMGQGTKTVTKHSDDVIIIKPKTTVNTKFTIEIDGADIKINGKPLSEYKNDDISISRRKQVTTEDQRMAELNALIASRSRFRGGATVYDNDAHTYGYGGSENLASGNKAFLGVGTEKNDDGEGVTITSVTDESAAEKAGLKEGDIITKINDTKISTPEELTKAIGKFNPDEKITVSYKRGNKEEKVTAVLTKRKNAQTFSFNTPDNQIFKNFNFDNNNFNFNWGKPRLGLKAQETEDGKGLKVLDIDDESAAEKAGIKEGDIITSFDGTEVNNIDTLRELSKPALDKTSFKVQIIRDGKPQEITVKIPKNLKSTSL